MPDDYELISDPSTRTSARTTVFNGLWRDNAITVQVLGLCSALAVTARLETALVMGLTVTIVSAASGLCISLVRNLTPARIRLITWMSLIATFVIVVDQFCKAFFWDVSVELGPYLGLIITNCILLGRAESFASRNTPLLSALDGAANGFGYAVVLCAVGVFRELLGTGQIEVTHLVGSLAVPVKLWTGYLPNDFLLTASGAFIVLGLIVALFNYINQRRSTRA